MFLDEPPTVLHDMVAGTGADLAIAMAIAMDPTPDVRAYLPAVPGDGAERPHLFLAIPHGLALLLGHLWDRMPPHWCTRTAAPGTPTSRPS